MILYKGKVYDNVKQEELLDRLPADLYTPINEGRRLDISAVIDACDDLAMRCHEVFEPRLFYGRGESFCICISEHRDVVLYRGV